MYIPSHFEIRDRAILLEACAMHPFGMLLAPNTDGSVEVSHLPFILHEQQNAPLQILCHVARSNPLAEMAMQGARMTAVFSGPHGYVSPLWYETPERQVPTWNYVVVHATGVSRTLSAEALDALVENLSRQYEGPTGWSTSQLPKDFRRDLVRGIVGIALEIKMENFVGKFKLSQNRTPNDQDRVREALAKRGTPDDQHMATWMTRLSLKRSV
jgi:transcriptional regulator